MLTLALHHGGRLYRAMILLAFVLTFLVAASCLTVRFWLLPNIENFHTQITSLLGRSLGLEVKIAKIEADWLGWRPHLALTDVQLLDAHHQVGLRLKRVDTALSWMTLLTQELRLAQLQIDDADLLIRRDAQGVLHVAGLSLSGAGSDEKFSDWLLHQAQILLRNGRLTWQDDFLHAPPLRMTQAQFRLENRHQRHRFALRFTPPATLAANIEIRGDFSGRSFADLSHWQGELFTQLNQVDIASLSSWIQLPAEIHHTQGSARAWFKVEHGKFTDITADLALQDVQSQLALNLPSLMLPRAQGRLRWTALEHGWQLLAKKLALHLPNGQALAPLDAEFRFIGAADSPFSSGEIHLNQMELSHLSVLLPFVPLPDAVRQNWTEFAPSGQVSELNANWQLTQGKAPQFAIKTRFNNLALRRVGNFPGVENLSGTVNGNAQHGELTLDSPDVVLDATQWLLAPISFNRFNAHAQWQHMADAWQVQVDQLQVANQDLSGSASGSFQTQLNSLGVLDLTLNVTQASVKKVVNYLPKKIIGKAMVHWLQQGLLAGKASEGQLRLKGKLEDFPFTNEKNGLFRVNAKAENVQVNFAPGWPHVEHANATLTIQGAHLAVESNHAQLDQAQVQKVFVSIPDLMSEEPLLQIRGEASGETAHGLSFIQHSPVRDYLAGFTDGMSASGQGIFMLKLDIPLSGQPLKLNGQYHLTDNDLQLGHGIPAAHHVDGDLHFTESTLNTNNVNFQALGGAAHLSINTATDGTLKIKAQGLMNSDAWHKEIDSPWWPYLSGQATWMADIASKGTQLGIVVNSSLRGLAVNLPIPFAKSASTAMPLKFELHTAGATKDVLWLQIGDLISARLLRTDAENQVRKFKRGYVNFGKARKIVDREGFWLFGNLPQLSLEGWGKLPHDTSDDSLALPTIDGIDVSVQKLHGFGSQFNDVTLHGQNHSGKLSAQFIAKAINGELTWLPQGQGKLIGRFKNISLGENNQKSATENDLPDVTLSQQLKNSTIPNVDLQIEQLTYHGHPLGRIELNANQIGQDILLNNLRISNSDGTLIGNGKWSLQPAQVHLALKLDMQDAGGLLTRLGYPNSMDNGEGNLASDLVWAGGPDELALANLEGNVSLKLNDGQFLQLDSGAAKLLSVFSLQSLPKRITLDFNDIFSNGFAFDHMEGQAQIRRGILVTQKLNLHSSAAEVSMSGQVDLNHETQSLRVKVLPTIGNSVSLLAFAAGPIVGTGVFLANKLLSAPLDQLVSFEYDISGSWSEPKVDKVIRKIPE